MGHLLDLFILFSSNKKYSFHCQCVYIENFSFDAVIGILYRVKLALSNDTEAVVDFGLNITYFKQRFKTSLLEDSHSSTKSNCSNYWPLVNTSSNNLPMPIPHFSFKALNISLVNFQISPSYNFDCK